MSVGSQIRSARKAQKLTQEALATKIGRTKGSIANYENGVSSPNVDDLLAIMSALNVDANYVYEWGDNTEKQKVAAPKDDDLSPHEREIALAYRAASDDDRAVVDAALKKYIMLQSENSTELAM